MKCKNCGQKLNDGDLFCGNCGAPVPSGHSSKKVVYIVIAVAVVLAIAAGVILALTIGSDSSDDSKPAAEIQSDTDVVNISNRHVRIDGKSIVGLMTIKLGMPMLLLVNGEDEGLVEEKFSSFLAE